MGGVVAGLVVDGRRVADGADVVGRDVAGTGGVTLAGPDGDVPVVEAVLGGLVGPDGKLVPALGEGVPTGEGPATPQPPTSASKAASSKQREPSPPLMEPV